jgi:hypothetical protein
MVKQRMILALFALAIGAARADSVDFSHTVTPSDFTAAGLEKLTPQELTNLNQLVLAYGNGALQQAQRQAAEADQARSAAEMRAKQAEADAQRARAEQATAQNEAKKTKLSFLNRTEALIAPGTKIEYQPVESRVVGAITGWDANTIFTLENGQRWQVSNYSHYYNGQAVKNPTATVRPARMFGGFEITIEGLGAVRVRLVNGPTYHEN